MICRHCIYCRKIIACEGGSDNMPLLNTAGKADPGNPVSAEYTQMFSKDGAANAYQHNAAQDFSPFPKDRTDKPAN
ncbi:hypothetical protein GCM10009413_07100 [Tatumella punctata]